MHRKRSESGRAASEATSAHVLITEKLLENDKLLSAFAQTKKRKIAAQEPLHASRTSIHEPPQFLYEDRPAIDEVELQLLAIESRRLDFEVKKWKQQQGLRRETLQLKREEITLKEATTKRKQETQMTELRAKILKALDEAGREPGEANEFFALLQG